MEENARIAIYDPKVEAEHIYIDLTETGVVDNRMQVEKSIEICGSDYEAAKSSDALVAITEWDEFRQLDYDLIYKDMHKPAFVSDGRLILDAPKLRGIGFKVHAIGKNRLEGRV